MSFLEKFELGELTYIDMHSITCGGKKNIMAIVLDPEKLPHRVKVGDYAGRHFGIITRITEDQIQLKEIYQNKEGGWVERDASMQRVINTGPRARYLYEEDHALEMLGKMDDSGKRLKERLIKCRELFTMADSAKRLACFDEAVGTLY